ncbi:hypothetical protein BFW87_14490 [Pseudomonas fluorescens]|uniref:DUF4329 domain-containing protein n=1 Tax=Pseudomonas fluorescens TaxID=294 RepID=A0A1T2YT41_PSEFL|nr:DUF4329 domain-containing protein [Pseudomonas fluorescens]OPA95248.1 hypothetical protein BFW87_14490 [Pseudomonas fluorescens]
MDDQPMREKRATLPRGHAKLGTLTPAFSSVDEVARYLHGSVGSNLQVEYGSVILRRSADGLYVGSEPISDRPTVFNFDLLLDSDAGYTTYLEPEGYQIVASWHTHPNSTAWVARENPAWTAHQITAFQGFYSEPDIMFNHQNRSKFREAYLSGPNGTLVKYQFDETAAALGFAHWIITRGKFESPHAFDGTIEGFYKKVASVGRLTFLISSPYWGGSLGQVPADWVPYKPWPVFADAQRALAHASVQIQRKPNLRQQALILQSDALADYAARDPDPVEGLAGVLPQLPLGYHLHGIYVHARPLPVQYPTLESWLYKNFISPLELAQHIARFRGYSQGPQSTLGASLYIRLRDEAVLRYRFSGSALESQLFAQAPDGQVIDNGWQAELLQGSLLTRDFVRKVAAAGELSVEKTSALWDRSGIVDTDWTPFSRFTLPSLSITFLSADDAARFIHGDINGRREQVLGGMILQQPDGRFVATQPVPTGPRPFAFDGLYPVDRQNNPIILNAGYRLHARYGTRLALSKTDPAYVARFKWTRQEAELSGQMFHPQDVADLLAAGVTGYLSGSQDSLIACSPATTSSEWRKQWKGNAARDDSAIATRLADATIKPADVVRTLAESGTLRVVIGNALWGPADFVEVDWGPWVRVLEFQRPATVSHGPVFRTADDAASDLYRRDPRDHVQYFASRYFAFILKHQSREEYVASELIPVTGKSPLLSLASLYGTRLPDGFDCHSLYYANQFVGNGSAAWLKRVFIEPEDLSEAIAQARIQTMLPPRGAPVYIATPEGALLRYQSPSTQGIFESRSEADSLETVRAKLNIGTLQPLQFVRRVASSGHLQVVRTSHCWGVSSDVTGLWVPYENLQRRRLSPAFLSMDDVAQYIRRRVLPNLDQPYGGIILRRDDGWFVATEPVRVSDEVFDIKSIFPDEMVTRGLYPPRTAVVASYHSRPATQWPFLLSPAQSAVYGNMFSTRLLAHSLSAAQARHYHYLLAPDGALIRLKPRPELKYPPISAAALVTRPRNRRDWLSGALERQIRNGELAPGEYVTRVSKTFDLQVVVGSTMWGAPGVVADWSPFASVNLRGRRYLEASVDPAFSPLHTRADDAVRYAHEHAGSRDEAQFGYVLQSTGNGHFVATLPVTEGGSDLAHRRVFADAGYPYRYQMAGLYLCGLHWGDIQPGGQIMTLDSIYRGLISPSRLIQAMYQVSATASRAALPIYLSCADGALLKFTVRNNRFVDYRDDLRLKLSQLSPRDYFRRMAAAGDLRILVPSVNWPSVGVVDAQWQPGRSRGVPAVGDNRWALGPVHAHRDDAAGYVHGRADVFNRQQAISALLEKTAANLYVPVLATPDEGFPSSIAPQLFSSVSSWPTGYQISAAHLLFHTGQDQQRADVDASYVEYFVSWRELSFYLYGLKEKKLPITGFYLTALDGALLSYTPSFGKDEEDLLAVPGKWTAKDGYTALAPTPSRVLSELARLGQFRVLRRGSFWTIRTLLGSDLRLPGNSTYRPGKDEL